jgi:hypothetical protein
VKAVAGRVTFGFKTSPQHVSFATLDETWAAAAELPAFVAAWMNDHFSDPAAAIRHQSARSARTGHDPLR